MASLSWVTTHPCDSAFAVQKFRPYNWLRQSNFRRYRPTFYLDYSVQIFAQLTWFLVNGTSKPTNFRPAKICRVPCECTFRCRNRCPHDNWTITVFFSLRPFKCGWKNLKEARVGTPNTRCQLQYVLFSFSLCPKKEIKRIRLNLKRFRKVQSNIHYHIKQKRPLRGVK